MAGAVHGTGEELQETYQPLAEPEDLSSSWASC